MPTPPWEKSSESHGAGGGKGKEAEKELPLSASTTAHKTRSEEQHVAIRSESKRGESSSVATKREKKDTQSDQGREKRCPSRPNRPFAGGKRALIAGHGKEKEE